MIGCRAGVYGPGGVHDAKLDLCVDCWRSAVLVPWGVWELLMRAMGERGGA